MLMLAFAIAGCGRKHPRVISKAPVAPRAPSPEQVREALKAADGETGLASWYGYPYHGRRAANGEIYDMEKLTAAHRTLPFGTWVRVTNLSNQKTVDVRITDRGPFIDGRIIDLSKAGARAIDMIGPGVARVRLGIIQASAVQAPVMPSLPPPPPPVSTPTPVASTPQPGGGAPFGLFAVQVAAFQDKSRADALREMLSSNFHPVRVVERASAPVFWRVLVGEAHSLDEANAIASQLRSQGRDVFVVSLEGVSLTPSGGEDASSDQN